MPESANETQTRSFIGSQRWGRTRRISEYPPLQWAECVRHLRGKTDTLD